MRLRHLASPARLLRGALATLLLAALAPLAHAQALDTPTLTHTGGGLAGSWLVMFSIFASAYALAYFVRKLWL